DTIRTYLEERTDVLDKLAREYISSMISEEFPLLSAELFEIKRPLLLERKGDTFVVKKDLAANDAGAKQKDRKKYRIDIPLFAYTELFKNNHKATLYNDYLYDWNIRLDVSLPGYVGENLREAYSEALSHYFGVLSKVLADPVSRDIVVNLKPTSEADEQTLKPEVGAIWIPTIESLKVVAEKTTPRDPAMILKAFNNTYLIRTWKVDDEEPFEAFVGHFLIGDPKGKIELE
ncbi:MAG: hypothetical protein HY518_05945, partial [Candidatus Aenigmarchaeota archaeon]|nr:hypothetical protein [Candidatus Aenigmarchaeota archaeon]